jgi:membrane-associated phospholipid phosphatase
MVAAAVWCVAAFWGLLVLAYYVGPTSWLDEAALHGFGAVDRPRINGVTTAIAHICNPLPYALASAALIVLAIGFRGFRTAAFVGFLLAGANATSQLLKPALAYHRELWNTPWHTYNISDAAYPSGHATAAMAFSLGVLMIVPRAYRPLAATLGVAFTLAVSFSILIMRWHFPSDVVGGYLVATVFGLVTIGGLRYVNERWPERGTVRQAAREAMPAPSMATIARGVLLVAVVAALIAASRAREIASFAERHTAAAAVASAIAVAAAVLLAAVVSITSRSRSRSGSR